MDEIERPDRAARPTPLTWPVGIAGDFRGVLDRRDGELHPLHPHRRRRHRSRPRRRSPPRPRAEREGDAWDARGRGGRAARRRPAPTTTRSCSSPASTTPGAVRLGGAQLRRRRSCSTRWSTWRRRRAARADVDGEPRARRPTPFSAFVFKVQAGMDTAHRDRLAFVRVVLGRLRARHGRHPRRAPASRSPPSTPSTVFGRERDDASTRPTPATSSAWSTPTALRRRATRSTSTRRSSSRRSRRFAPEHFAVAARRGHRQAQAVPQRASSSSTQEGVVQVLRSDRARRPGAGARRGRADAVRGGASTGWSTSSARPIELDRLPYSWPGAPTRRRRRRSSTAARRRGAAAHRRRAARAVQRQVGAAGAAKENNPELTLEPLVAAQL